MLKPGFQTHYDGYSVENLTPKFDSARLQCVLLLRLFHGHEFAEAAVNHVRVLLGIAKPILDRGSHKALGQPSLELLPVNLKASVSVSISRVPRAMIAPLNHASLARP